MVKRPSLVADDQLENAVCEVLQHIGTNITDEKIESCHRLNKNTDRTIVKYLKRKDRDQTMRVKSELKKLKTAEIDLREIGQNSALMEACVPTIWVCGTSTRNFGIGTNCFLFLLLMVQFA